MALREALDATADPSGLDRRVLVYALHWLWPAARRWLDHRTTRLLREASRAARDGSPG